MKVIIEKIKYANNYVNSYWREETVAIDSHYKIKVQWRQKESDDLMQKLQSFCKDNDSSYRWVQDVYEEREKVHDNMVEAIWVHLENVAKEWEVCSERQEKIFDVIEQYRQDCEYYSENCMMWVVSRDSYFWEDFNCFCTMLSVFLTEQGFREEGRDAREERWILTQTND